MAISRSHPPGQPLTPTSNARPCDIQQALCQRTNISSNQPDSVFVILECVEIVKKSDNALQQMTLNVSLRE
jgi:hypothetical protein